MSQGTLPLAPQEPKRIVEMEPEDFVKLYKVHPGVHPITNGWVWKAHGLVGVCPMCLLAASRLTNDPALDIDEFIRFKGPNEDSYSAVIARILGEHQSVVRSFARGFDGFSPGFLPHESEGRRHEDRLAYELGRRTKPALDQLRER